MRRLGMLFVGDTSKHTIEAAAGDYSTLCTLLMLLAEALKGEGITDTLEGDTLTIRVKHIELLLVELHRDTEEAKHLDSLLEHTSRGTLGMLSLQKAGGEQRSLKGDFSTLLAAVKVLEKPLKKLFSVEAHSIEAGVNVIRIEKEGAFKLLAVELDSQSSADAAPQQSTQEKLGVFSVCNHKTGGREGIVGDYSTLVSVIELFEKAFTKVGYYCTKTRSDKVGNFLSLIIEYEDGKTLFSMQTLELREKHLKKYNLKLKWEDLPPEKGTLRLFFKADGESYEREVNYITCKNTLLGLADYLEDLFDIYTSEGKEGEVVAASTQIIMRLEPKEERE